MGPGLHMHVLSHAPLGHFHREPRAGGVFVAGAAHADLAGGGVPKTQEQTYSPETQRILRASTKIWGEPSSADEGGEEEAARKRLRLTPPDALTVPSGSEPPTPTVREDGMAPASASAPAPIPPIPASLNAAAPAGVPPTSSNLPPENKSPVVPRSVEPAVPPTTVLQARPVAPTQQQPGQTGDVEVALEGDMYSDGTYWKWLVDLPPCPCVSKDGPLSEGPQEEESRCQSQDPQDVGNHPWT